MHNETIIPQSTGTVRLFVVSYYATYDVTDL